MVYLLDLLHDETQGLNSDKELGFLKKMTKRAVTAEAGSLSQYIATFTEKLDPAVAFPLEYLVGEPSKAASNGREKKTSSDPHPIDP